MPRHLIKTFCQAYPPFTGEFLAETQVKNNTWTVICPPFPATTFTMHGDNEEALAVFCNQNNAELLEYCPVIRDQNLTMLPSTINNRPVCFINCTFAEHLGNELHIHFGNSRFYNCRLPAAFLPTLRFIVNIAVRAVPDNLESWHTVLATKITPDTLTELITQNWSQYDLKVTVRS